MEPSGSCVERAPASLFVGGRQQTMDQVVETRRPSVLVHIWCLDSPRAWRDHHALLPIPDATSSPTTTSDRRAGSSPPAPHSR